MSQAHAVRSVAVLGAGATGLSAAAAIARALPQVAVTLVATAPDPAALTDRLPVVLPALGRFHASIGLGEQELLRGDAINYRLALRFRDWSTSGDPWLFVHGEHGRAIGSIAFHQLWARARRDGAAAPFHAYSAAAALAQAERFVHPESDPGSPLDHGYALRCDPSRYADVLGGVAERLGVRRAAGAFIDAERRDDGGIAAVLVEGGARISADLFVDAAGPTAPLRSFFDDAWEDWSPCLPFDRLLLASAPPGPETLCDEVIATALGWRWTSHSPAADMQGLCYAAGATSEEDARAALGHADAELIPLRMGRRPPWRGNVVAIGDAAVALDPLHGLNLALAHGQIERLLELWPSRDPHPALATEYERRTARQARRARDFAAVHYIRSGRSDGTVWQAASTGRASDGLARTLGQFERRGRLPFFEEELVDTDGWLAALLGLGVLPRGTDALAQAVGAQAAATVLRRTAETMAALPDRVPHYIDYLAQCRRAATTSG